MVSKNKSYISIAKIHKKFLTLPFQRIGKHGLTYPMHVRFGSGLEALERQKKE